MCAYLTIDHGQPRSLEISPPIKLTGPTIIHKQTSLVQPGTEKYSNTKKITEIKFVYLKEDKIQTCKLQAHSCR